MTEQLNNSASGSRITFVIGAAAAGKSTFIREQFAPAGAVILDVYDYQQAAGLPNCTSLHEEFRCMFRANDNILTDMLTSLRQGKHVVVEHTLFRAKRRIAYLDVIRAEFPDITAEVYVLRPDDETWKTYIRERGLHGSFESHRSHADQIEFPNPAEGFDRIYEVTDQGIRLRMDEPDERILAPARQELLDEREKIRKEEEEETARRNLLESMKTRPFWHYCECCGAKKWMTAEEAYEDGWDYPPKMGVFGLLGPRTCGSCGITETLYWKVQQQSLPIVMKRLLTETELQTWERIRSEPESLLVEE